MKKIIILVLFFIFYLTSQSQNTISGNWEGNILAMGSELKIKVKFDKENEAYKGNIDIPAQGAYGLKLNDIKIERENISFKLQITPNNIAFFNGTLKDTIIEGKFSQMGIDGTFNLRKKEIPRINNSFIEKEVTFYNKDIKLCGTLSLPDTNKKHPAIILISGSGAQNRDEEIYDFPIFKEISDHLTKSGFAVLRYDDRGIGCSDGSVPNSSLFDFSDDIISAVNFLKSQKNINSKKIGLLGHSEGCTVASIVASKINDIQFMVLLAPPGDSGTTIIKEQIKNLYKMNGLNDTIITKEIANAMKVHNVIIKDDGWEELRQDIKEKIKAKFEESSNVQLNSIENKEIFIENYVENQITSYKSKWLKSFLITNPKEYIVKVKCPVLAIFGEKDLQVEAKSNSEKIESALKKGKNKKYKIEIIPSANHLFQKAETGHTNEYIRLEKKFINGLLDLISNWLISTTK